MFYGIWVHAIWTKEREAREGETSRSVKRTSEVHTTLMVLIDGMLLHVENLSFFTFSPAIIHIYIRGRRPGESRDRPLILEKCNWFRGTTATFPKREKYEWSRTVQGDFFFTASPNYEIYWGIKIRNPLENEYTLPVANTFWKSVHTHLCKRNHHSDPNNPHQPGK